MVTLERKPDLSAYLDQQNKAVKDWEMLFSDKSKVVRHAMSVSNSKIKPHRTLILVDVQGVYLGLQSWLSENNVPMDDGVLLGSFAHLQIERVGQEVASRVVAAHAGPSCDLKELFDSIKINYVDGKAYLGNEPKVAMDATYLDISMSFEMFYAPAPLKEIEGYLFKAARSGSQEAREQLKKAESGILTPRGAFRRDYKAYDDFVSHLKQSALHARTHEGFFNFYVGDSGLRNFDEKEVDTRITVRAMDALYRKDADSLCIVSSDQDFMPLHSRAEDFGITSFHVDLSKFTEQNKVGRKIKDLNHRFIRCGIDPSWPLNVLLHGVSAPDLGHFADHNYSQDELNSLCSLHNRFNDVKIELTENENGSPTIRLYRPVS
ncbi:MULTISPECIES: NYN domain-containing protein [unclassified Halomonas]|uniref:NYN domain-containing protein n=1 Tax=unclassified Halomonas TaxID=2609666 RepID=UPI0018FE2E37|nr:MULTISPECIES: NYN domain-containing protein [unclassified Halomonas]